MKKLLITADSDDATKLLTGLTGSRIEPVHLPLEHYKYASDRKQGIVLEDQREVYNFVVFGSLRNSRHYLTWLNQFDLQDEFRQKIHLVMNRPEMEFLEKHEIPAILPKENARPIDIMEFLLRISISGGVLYPCAEESSEEIPGLLQELQIPVSELTVCRSVPFEKSEIDQKRKEIKKVEPDGILFHSRSSVIRTRTAFPDIDLSSKKLIAASAGVAEKLRQEGFVPEVTAEGSWESIIKEFED